MYAVEKLQEKLNNTQMLLGTHVGFDSPFITEMLGGCGFDAIWIDAEHCALDKKDIQTHLLACRAAGTAGIVRVPWNDFVYIKGILDMGADGIIVPMVNSFAEAVQVVSAVTYPPEGIRGMGLRRAANYGLWDKTEYIRNTREKVWTLVQVEHIDALTDLERIAELPGITGFIVGPNDFAMSMVVDGRAGTPADSVVQEQYDRIGKILSRHPEKVFGVSGQYSERFVVDWSNRGANLLFMNFDFHYIINGAKDLLSKTRSTLKNLQKQ